MIDAIKGYASSLPEGLYQWQKVEAVDTAFALPSRKNVAGALGTTVEAVKGARRYYRNPEQMRERYRTYYAKNRKQVECVLEDDGS